MRHRPRGSGSIRQEGDGWSLRIQSRGRIVYESGFRTRREAEDRAALLRAERIHKRLGVAADPKLVPTLGELAKPWLERRKLTHGAEDGYRWRGHLAPSLGHLRPDEVDAATIRALVESKRAELAPGTIRVVIAVLSSLYEDLLERGMAARNPARHLPKSILRLMRSDHDPRTVPFVERLEDVRRIYLGMPSPLNVAYALGALAGLRTGEVFQLRWISVDLDSGTILVSEGGRGGTTKDRDPRPVPIQDALWPVLTAWRLTTGGKGRVIPALRIDGAKVDKGTPGPALRRVLTGIGLTRLAAYPHAWYAATRHTFASQWAMAGRPLRELQAILGHASITETERYAHLLPGHFGAGVRSALAVDLGPAGARPASVLEGTGDATPEGGKKKRATSRNR